MRARVSTHIEGAQDPENMQLKPERRDWANCQTIGSKVGRRKRNIERQGSAGAAAACLGRRLLEAVAFAADLHANQARKVTGGPYLRHLLEVAQIAVAHGANEDEAIAALLHDAVEDQGGLSTLKKIRRPFGDKVAQIVGGCTAPKAPGATWRQRKAAYLARLPKTSSSVLLVSAADKVANARALLIEYRVIGDPLWARFNGTMPGIIWYYRRLAETFRNTGPEALADELDRVVSEIERLVSERQTRRRQTRARCR